MKIPNTRPVVAIVCLLLLAVGTVPLAVGSGTQQCSTIDGPTTITEPGCYELTSDVSNAGATTYVTIAADDVVLDGNGHEIDGTSASGSSAVLVDGSAERSSVTIRNLVTAEWERGIVLQNTANARVERVTVREATDAGLVVRESSGATVQNVRAWGINGPGVRLVQVTGTTIADTRLEIVGSGIESSRSGTNTLQNVTVSGADGAGFVKTGSTAEATASGVEIAGVEQLAFAAFDVRLSGVDDDPPELSGYRQIGRLIEVSTTSSSGFLVVTRPYGETDAAGTPSSEIGLWQYERETGEWRELAAGTQSDDPAVTANVVENGPVGLFTEATATQISIASVDDPVAAGETMTVDVQVENTGTDERSQTVTLTVDGQERDATTVTLPPGETVPVTLRWQTAADDSGEYTATVTSGDASRETTVTVGGRTPDESSLTVSPAAPSFGETRVGASPSRTITVENTGDETVVVTDLSLDGAVDQFRVEGGTLALGVEPGQTRSVTIAFEPTRGGPASATAEIQTASQGTVEIPLSGTGIAEVPAIETSTDTLRFGNRTVDETVTRSVTVRNTGEAELTVTDVFVVGTDRSAFSAGTDGFTLAPGARRTVDVTFTPTSVGGKHATLRLLSDDPDDPQTDIWLANSDTVVQTEVSSTDTETTVNATFSNVSADEPVEVNVSQSTDTETNFSLDSLSITVNESTNFTANLTSSAGTLDSTPKDELPNATEGVGYLSINSTASDDSIEQANVTFRLRRDALNDTDPEDVALYRYHDGEWKELTTSMRSVGQRYVSFVAVTPGFSEFSAGAKQPSFEFARSNVSLSTVTEGESVDIEVLITNEGGADGTFTADLLLNGEVVETRQVTIAASGSRLLVFERTFDQNGTYEVRVNDQPIGEIRVTEEGVTSPVESTSATGDDDASILPVSGTLLPVIAGVLAVLAVGLLGVGLLVRSRRGGGDEPAEPDASGGVTDDNDTATAESTPDGPESTDDSGDSNESDDSGDGEIVTEDEKDADDSESGDDTLEDEAEVSDDDSGGGDDETVASEGSEAEAPDQEQTPDDDAESGDEDTDEDAPNTDPDEADS